jgi:hyperosmotically inducible periplasmic protein
MQGFKWLGCLALVAGIAVGCAQSDPGITTAVKTKFASDDVVKAHQINVDTKEGIVTLSGSVDSSNSRERAVQLARATDGVASVVDNLIVTPAAAPTSGIGDTTSTTTSDAADRAGNAMKDTGGVMSDAAITSAVKTKFLADTRVSGLKIDVDTKDGVVTLTGTVPAAERDHALALARETSGVRSVVNRLK